jgi:hypothetical protein
LPELLPFLNYKATFLIENLTIKDKLAYIKNLWVKLLKIKHTEEIAKLSEKASTGSA